MRKVRLLLTILLSLSPSVTKGTSLGYPPFEALEGELPRAAADRLAAVVKAQLKANRDRKTSAGKAAPRASPGVPAGAGPVAGSGGGEDASSGGCRSRWRGRCGCRSRWHARGGGGGRAAGSGRAAGGGGGRWWHGQHGPRNGRGGRSHEHGRGGGRSGDGLG